MSSKVQRQQIDTVLRPNARMFGRMRRKLRVEPDIDAIGAVVELELAEKRRIRPDIAHVEQFPPAMMSDDDVRSKPKLL
jgi:hypothetical protein